jgi:hypothetical protein
VRQNFAIVVVADAGAGEVAFFVENDCALDVLR